MASEQTLAVPTAQTTYPGQKATDPLFVYSLSVRAVPQDAGLFDAQPLDNTPRVASPRARPAW
jgi:hypothetical protein